MEGKTNESRVPSPRTGLNLNPWIQLVTDQSYFVAFCLFVCLLLSPEVQYKMETRTGSLIRIKKRIKVTGLLIKLNKSDEDVSLRCFLRGKRNLA